MFCFNAMTHITFNNISSNVLLHSRPPVPLTEIAIHLGATRMNRQWGVMCFLHDLISHKLEARYDNAASEIQGSIFRQREIPVLFKVKIFLHQTNYSIFSLCTFNSLLKVWFNNQGI